MVPPVKGVVMEGFDIGWLLLIDGRQILSGGSLLIHRFVSLGVAHESTTENKTPDHHRYRGVAWVKMDISNLEVVNPQESKFNKLLKYTLMSTLLYLFLY